MARRSLLLITIVIVVGLVSIAQALYFAGLSTTPIQDAELDSISYFAPFQPVAIFYALVELPLLGVPLNIILLLMLLYFSGYFSSRSIWIKLALFFVAWSIVSVIGSMAVLRAVWHV